MPAFADCASSALLIEDQAEAPGPQAGAAPVPDLPAAVLASEGRDPGAPGATEFILIRSDRAATKSYRFDPGAGRPVKAAEPGLSSGMVYRASLSGTKPLAELERVLEALPSNVVLACGTMADRRDAAPLTTRDRLARTPGAITRTKGFATYPAGRPGLLMLDHDAKDLPDPVRTLLDAAGGFATVLAVVFPAFGRAGLLTRPSVSTGIRATATGAMTPGGGCHLYAVAEDGADLPAFVKRLHQHLVLNGLGWVFVSKAGHSDVRSLIDTDASGDPERLAFEADAILGAGLEHVAGARACHVERDGVPLDTASLPDLTPEELAQLAAIKAELLAAAEPEAAPLRAKAQQERADKLIAGGVALDKARARVEQAFDHQRLDPAETVHLDDGRTPTVADILRDPAAFDGATGADPLEPGYGGGRDKAIWLTRGLHVRCYSQAHGGQSFEAGWTARDLIEAWDARRDATELCGMWLRTILDDPDADQAALAAAGVPTWALLEFGLADLADLAGMVAREEWCELANLQTQLGGAFADALDASVAHGDVDRAAVAAGLARGAALLSAPTGAIPDGWADRLTRGKNGTVSPTLSNALAGLGMGCGLTGHLRLDQACGLPVLIGVPPGSAVWNALSLGRAPQLYRDPLTDWPVFAWSDTLLTTALVHLEGWGAGLPQRGQAEHAVARIAEEGAFSSVGRWLRGLSWDSVPRLDGWLARHAGADPSSGFNAVALSRWMIGGVARALFPDERGDAAQMDTALVLAGVQGAGKSQFFRELCPVQQWHTESSLGNLSGKDAPMQLAAHWIVDMAEGGSIKANSVEAFKQFMTTRFDSFRPPYGRNVVRLPRRNVFAMTINPDGAGFLRDGTGNRRFWVVEVAGIDLAQLRRDRDQLWAEAVARFDKGERWWLDKGDPQDATLMDEAAAAAEVHRIQTTIEEQLRRYVLEAPPFDPDCNTAWKPRPEPLTVMSAGPVVLREIGQGKALNSTYGAADFGRAATSMGWVPVRVKTRSGPVKRDQKVWVNSDGAAAWDADKRHAGPARRFSAWLEEEARGGRLGLRDGSGLDAEWFKANGVDLPDLGP